MPIMLESHTAVNITGGKRKSPLILYNIANSMDKLKIVTSNIRTDIGTPAFSYEYALLCRPKLPRAIDGTRQCQSPRQKAHRFLRLARSFQGAGLSRRIRATSTVLEPLPHRHISCKQGPLPRQAYEISACR